MQHVRVLATARVVLGLGIVLIACSAAFFVRYLLTPATGLVVNYPEAVERDGVVVFSPRTPFSAAVRAGLVPGTDVVAAVNGAPIRTLRDLVVQEARLRGHDAVTVTVLRGAEGFDVQIVPRMGLERPDWVVTGLFAAALAFAALYLLVVLPDRRYSIPLSLAALFYLVFTCVKPFYYESMATNALIHLGKCSSWLLVFFAVEFPRPHGPRWARRVLYCALSAVFLGFVATRLVYFHRWAASGSVAWYEAYRGLGRAGNIADLLAYVAFGGLLTAWYLRDRSGETRRAVEWFLAGVVLGLVPYFFLDQLPLILEGSGGYRLGLGGVAPLFLVAVPVFVVLGVSGGRMFTLRRIAHRYVRGAVVVLLLAGGVSAAYRPLVGVLVEGYGMAASPAGTVACVLLVCLGIGLARLGWWVSARWVYPWDRRAVAGLVDRLEGRIRALQRDSAVAGSEARRGTRGRVREELRLLARGLERGPAAALRAALDGDITSRNEVRQRAERSLHAVERFVSLFGARGELQAEVTADYLCRRSLSEVRRQRPDLRASLTVQSSWSMRCHVHDMIRAIAEVVRNAVEAQDSSPMVAVYVGVERRGGFIEIRDEGGGVSDARRLRAVQPLFTTKAEHGGLGLYFTRVVTERDGGDLVLESRSGRGTTARLVFTSGVMLDTDDAQPL